MSANDFIQNEKVYSVSQLNRESKRVLSQHFSVIRVEGELSNLSTPSSGHLYFSLKDSQAQVRCAMFKPQRRRLPFKPEIGLQVIATAQVSLYEPRGDYQLIIERMEPAGDGALQLAFEKLKLRLLNEGLFAAEKKRPLPLIPQCIGIITSPSGAAIRDITTVLRRRFPAIPAILYPVAVQGDNAKFEIVSALKTATQRLEADVLILARGGGSMEDLWAFNEEMVARAIADSQIPVVTGIGHETDTTIADFVADVRAPTPSAAAEQVAPDQIEWLNAFKAYETRLTQLNKRRLSHYGKQLDWLIRALQPFNPAQQLQRDAQRLDELESRLIRQWRQAGLNRRNQLLIMHSQLKRYYPQHRIDRQNQKINYLNQRLTRGIRSKLERINRQHAAISQTLHAVSPVATLERGYAIVRRVDTGEIIKNIDQAATNNLTETRLSHGSFISQIKEIKHDS